MSKNLVIVESPAKAKTINKILGKDFVVKASMGHVRDLPQKELGVDVEKDFKPKYTTIKGREKVIGELKAIASECESIYLAPDPDREGEAIAWHLMAALRDKKADNQKFYRVTYNEITAPAIRQAFSNPGEIDMHKVDSQQARRVLDRLVGYQVSPLLWRRIRGASSAGRVQTVAVRLVCERERAIQDFKPEEYWLMGARVRKFVDPRDAFLIRLARIGEDKAEIKSSEQAQKIQSDLEGRALRVSAIIPREISKRPGPSYITSSLQQAASRFFGFPPSRTMRLAQKLYEGVDLGDGTVGLITYMRTDSVAISPVAQNACREYVAKAFGVEYLPDRPPVYKSRSGAQEAHEAIRPTEVSRSPDQLVQVLDPDELKLYRLIWQRFVASQMAPARIAQKTVEIEAVPPAGDATKYLFRASTSEVLFPGYMKVTGQEEERKEKEAKEEERKDAAISAEDEETFVPPLEVGEKVEKLDWLADRKETQPPPRYTEASLIKALEEYGIGRPSTYASILSTIQDRGYVEKDKRALKPTPMGVQANEYLVQHLSHLFDVKFTAGMEEQLDEIEQGTVAWTDMMRKFYESLQVWLKEAKGPPADVNVVRRLIEHLEGGVKEWAPEQKRGKRTYGDQKFVKSVREQLEKAEKPISDRQLHALKRMAVHYERQVPGLDELAAELGITEAIHTHRKALQPPGPETFKKVEVLKNVTFDPPRTFGKKTYDDKEFFESFKRQIESGKSLTENQARFLDRLVLKYSDQIPNFEALLAELKIDMATQEGDATCGPILDLCRNIKEWKPPVLRGKRTWDDKEFFESLSRQFGQKKQLSFKQVAALKKLARRYGEQIPNYDGLVESMALLPRKKTKEEPAAEA